jgi:hypothetical protein
MICRYGLVQNEINLFILLFSDAGGDVDYEHSIEWLDSGELEGGKT